MRLTRFAAAALLAGVAIVVAGPASPAAAATCAAHGTTSDFNGDGYEDLAVAEPGSGGGRLHVLYGTASGLTATSPDDTFLVSGAPYTGNYGTSVAAGDFNGDGCDDLALSDPYQTVNGQVDAGFVAVFFGSASGLGASSMHLTFADGGGTPASGDYFGYGLAVGDVNGDNRQDLIVGTPNEDSVDVFLGTANGLSTNGHLFREGTNGVPGSLASSGFGAHGFGYALATGDFTGDGDDDVAIGTVGETVAGHADAGAVIVLRGSSTGAPLTTTGAQKWSQGTAGVPGSPEEGDNFGQVLATGDFNGNGRTDLAIGTPDETVNGHPNAGAVNVLYASGPAGLSASGAQLLDENTPGIPGPAADDDWFGQSLAGGFYNLDVYADLAIGVPGRNVGGVDAGAVDVLYGNEGGARQLTEATPGIPGTPEAGDDFGYSLRNLWTVPVYGSQLAVGVPLESVGSTPGAGMVVFIPRDGDGLTGTGAQSFNEGTDGVKGTLCDDCRFGWGLG